MSEGEQLSLVPAEIARDEAIARVSRSHADWIPQALMAVRYIARARGHGGTFTTDAVWAVLNGWGVGAPIEPRALGAAMRQASKLGLCEPTNLTSKSTRIDCHARPLRVWRIG